MTKQKLNGAQISAGFEQVDSEGMSKGMRCNRLGNAGQRLCWNSMN